MSWRMPLWGTLWVALLLTAPAQAQEKKTPSEDAALKEAAQLVPASTLVFVEMRHPDKLARELAALTKGSALEDMAATLGKARAKMGDRDDLWWFSDMLGMIGTFASPEMLAEAGRLQGGFFAITGIGKDGPEMVGVLLSGSSNAPTFFMRTFLSVDPEMRAKEEIEGVQTYQARRREWNQVRPVGPGGAPLPPPVARDVGPIFAILPGAIVMGTRDATHDVIRRFKGKAKSEALSATTAYKASAKLREQPGFYFQTDLPALAKQLDPLFTDPKNLNSATWKLAKLAVNPDAFSMASGNVTLAAGTLGVQLQIDVDARATSPVLELLPDRKGSLDLLNAAPADALLSFALSFPDGATRWQKFLTLLDTLAKESGSKDVPSKELRDLEQRAKLQIGKELFGPINNIGVVFEMRSSVPKNGMRVPMLLVNAVDSDAAKSIEEQVIPKLVSLGTTGESPLPTREKILEQSVSILPDPTKTWGMLAYGRSGKLVVVGQDRKTVAEALLAYSKKQGVLAHKSVGPVLEKLDSPIGAGTFSVGQALVEALRDIETPRAMMHAVPAVGGPGAPPPLPPQPGPGEKKEPKKDDKPKAFEKYVTLMTKEADAVPLSVVSLQRTKERLTLDIQHTGLRTYSARVINIWVDSAVERYTRDRGNRGGFGGGAVIDAPATVPDPAVPPPPPPPIEKK